MPAQKKMTVKVVKPFCKVCHDAGKPESEYSSHFVRSDTGPNSKVTCPTLLAQECRYCCKTGHTVKFCPVLADQKKTDTKTAKKSEFLEAQVNKPVTKKHKKKQNAFEVLDFESDSEKEQVKITPTHCKEEKPQVKDEFPALSSKSGSISAVPVLTGYANIAAKSRSQFEAEQQQVAAEKYEKELIERSIKGAKQVAKKEVPVKSISWADCYDSDDDDDEDDVFFLSREAPWVDYNRIAEIEDATW
jgi:hypothetical protein